MRFTSLSKRLVIALALIAFSSSSVQAFDLWNKFCTSIGKGYSRNNAWPEPFREADAIAVIAPFQAMKDNGWRLHNTLGNEQFRPADNALQPSGRDSLAWIATQAPESRRQVYVVRGRTEQDTRARVASVQNALEQLDLQGAPPMVAVTDRIPPSYSGAWANSINRRWLENLPAPQLPTQSASGTQAVTTQ